MKIRFREAWLRWWRKTMDREPTEVEEIAAIFLVVVGSYLALYALVNTQ